MASLADIPDTLLTPDNRANFVNWLVVLPLELAPKRDLATIWRRFTRSPIPVDEWQRIERTALKSTSA